jgi:UDP-glucose 4-epimerase
VSPGARRRIVVTGGVGFIGTHTVKRLVEQGDAVLVIDDMRHACGQPVPDSVEASTAEISSPAAAAAIASFKPDAILHLAAQGGVSRSLRDPAADAQINVVGTVAMLKAGADSGCRRFVFASSGGAIYGRARRLPSSERSRPEPLSPYGAAKLAGEAYLGMFSRTFGLRTLALRYSNVYGPFQDGTGEAGVVAITCDRLLGGRPPEIRGDGQQTRDFIFVEDVAAANLRALAGSVQGSLNIGTGQPTSVQAIVDRLAEVAGYGGPVTYVEGRAGEVRATELDARRAGQQLHWSPTVALDEGLRRTFVSFQEQLPARQVRATTGPA